MSEEQTTSPPGSNSGGYSDEQRRGALRRVANIVGNTPTVTEYREHSTDSEPSSETIRAHFADDREPWLAALWDAGLDPDLYRHRGGEPTRDDIKHSLRIAASNLAEWPSPDLYRETGLLPSIPTIYDRFGDWQLAIEAAKQSPSNETQLSKLVRNGPSQLENSLTYVSKRKYGIKSAHVERAGVNVTVCYLPGHEPETVADALFESIPEQRRTKGLGNKLRTHSGIEERVVTALRERLVINHE